MSVFKLFDRHASLMSRMADTLGVDVAELMMRGRIPPTEYRNSVFRCTGCTQVAACEDWMDAHPAGAGHTPNYCRNRLYFEGLAQA